MIKADLMKSFKKSFIVLLLSLCVVLSLSQYKVAAMRLIPDPGSSIPSGIKNALASCDSPRSVKAQHFNTGSPVHQARLTLS
jgi:hypothetical protein